MFPLTIILVRTYIDNMVCSTDSVNIRSTPTIVLENYISSQIDAMLVPM